MIYTVTCNPALDYTLCLPRLVPGELNRPAEGVLTPGGKGINVSLVLAALGMPGKAIAFTAGETGALLESMLRRRGVETDFVELPAGSTRINVKLRAGEETELNAPGAPVDGASLAALLHKLEEVQPGDTVCFCGSLPPGMKKDVYATLVEVAASRGARTVLDASGEALLAGLAAHPWLIKPNRQELSELLGVKVETLTDVSAAAARLQMLGAQNVLVSLGGEGALLRTTDGTCYMLPAPAGEVRGTVGSGDSMVAGFLAGFLSCESWTEALRLGVAAGSATAFTEGLADKEKIYAVLGQVPEPARWCEGDG